MPVLTDEHKRKVKEMFDQQLEGPVAVKLFHTGGDDQFTSATREIMQELAALSDGRITLTELQLDQHGDQASQYGIDRTPALVFENGEGKDQSFRFFGAPAGYEFMALLEDLIDVSRGKTRLSDQAREKIQSIGEEMVIQVFTTPT